MALNEMIAQGAQFKMPDPLEQYGRIAQIQQAQNQNALAQYQISSAQRADETNTNFLRELRAAGDDPAKQRQALLNAGKVKDAADLETSALTRQEKQGIIQKQQRESVDRMKLDLSNNPSDENIKAFMQDIDLHPTFSDVAKAIAKRGLTEMLGMTVDERKKSLSMSGMSGAERATARRPIASGGTLLDLTGDVIGQAPEPGFTLGNVRYPRGYMDRGVVTAPEAAPAAVKPPDKIAIMTALGYPLTPEGNAAYETDIRAKSTVAASTGTLAEMEATGIPRTQEGLALYYRLKEKAPVVAPEARTPEEKNAELIALGAGPKGSDAFNAALRAEVARMTAKPPAAVKAEPTTNEMTNARAIALKAGPEGSDAFNAVFFPEMSRMTAKPITAPESTTPDIKNATALALLKGERGSAAFNKEFVKQMEKSTAKSGGGEGGGTTVPKAPSGYRFNKTGDLEPIPGGPAAGKPLTDLQKQGLKKDFAADTSKIKSAVDTADELEKLTDELVGNPDKKIKPHPGLGGITGYAGLLPSLPSGDATKAEQKLETFKGKIKTLGRSLASLDGKLGNMAVQEWKFISDAVQEIRPTAGNLDEQMRDVVRQARLLAKNLRDKFDLTYDETATAPSRPAAALAPADKQALDWANANPKDPRSLQIKQRLGQ